MSPGGVFWGSLALAAAAGWIFWWARSEPSKPPWIGNPDKEPDVAPDDEDPR